MGLDPTSKATLSTTATAPLRYSNTLPPGLTLQAPARHYSLESAQESGASSLGRGVRVQAGEVHGVRLPIPGGQARLMWEACDDGLGDHYCLFRLNCSLSRRGLVPRVGFHGRYKPTLMSIDYKHSFPLV